jgi:hypothetical protein
MGTKRRRKVDDAPFAEMEQEEDVHTQLAEAKKKIAKQQQALTQKDEEIQRLRNERVEAGQVPSTPEKLFFEPILRGSLLLQFRDLVTQSQNGPKPIHKVDRARSMAAFGILNYPAARTLELNLSHWRLPVTSDYTFLLQNWNDMGALFGGPDWYVSTENHQFHFFQGHVGNINATLLRFPISRNRRLFRFSLFRRKFRRVKY